MKLFIKITLCCSPIVSIVPLISSCNFNQVDKFQKYANVNDVFNKRNGWRQTLNSQFGNQTANQFPPRWDFRQTTDVNGGQCYHRRCGDKTFIWIKDNVDNSKNGYLKINYQQGAEYTDPNDSSFKTNNYSGSISTEHSFEQAFGYWEVDAKFLDKHYGWAAFWLQCESEGQVGHGGEDGSEIDIFESFNWKDFKNEVRLNTMADGYDSHYKEFGTAGYYVDQEGTPINIYDDFHKFGFLWTPTTYYMYVDRNLVFKTNAPIANKSHPSRDSHMGPNDPGKTTSQAPNGLPFSEYDGQGQFLIKNFICYQNRNFEPYIKSPSDFS